MVVGLLLVPFWLVVIAIGAVAGRVLGWKAGFATATGLALCRVMGLWGATVETACLVLISVLLAVVVGVPVGVLAGYSPRLTRFLEPVLDLIQTLPPYIYLLPAIALILYVLQHIFYLL